MRETSNTFQWSFRNGFFEAWRKKLNFILKKEGTWKFVKKYLINWLNVLRAHEHLTDGECVLFSLKICTFTKKFTFDKKNCMFFL